MADSIGGADDVGQNTGRRGPDRVAPIDGQKVCCRCQRVQSIDQFKQDRLGRWNSWCRDCHREYARQRRAKGLDRYPHSRRKYRLKADHDLTPEEYAAIVERQKGACAICGQPGGSKRLAVDHDHRSGLFRGLLCIACNVSLGGFRDDPALLRRAADYLEECARAYCNQ